jgi:hypothetical protein
LHEDNLRGWMAHLLPQVAQAARDVEAANARDQRAANDDASSRDEQRTPVQFNSSDADQPAFWRLGIRRWRRRRAGAAGNEWNGWHISHTRRRWHRHRLRRLLITRRIAFTRSRIHVPIPYIIAYIIGAFMPA